MDIIVTTPSTLCDQAAAEAQGVITDGGGEYFRRLSLRPKNFSVGEKVWYVERGYVRGFAVCSRIEEHDTPQICGTTEKVHASGCYIYMDAKTWKWIEPVEKKGFQGWAYFDPTCFPVRSGRTFALKVIGGWLDSMPEVTHDMPLQVSEADVHSLTRVMLREQKEYLRMLTNNQLDTFLGLVGYWDRLCSLNQFGVPMSDYVIQDVAKGVGPVMDDARKRVSFEAERTPPQKISLGLPSKNILRGRTCR